MSHNGFVLGYRDSITRDLQEDCNRDGQDQAGSITYASFTGSNACSSTSVNMRVRAHAHAHKRMPTLTCLRTTQYSLSHISEISRTNIRSAYAPDEL